MDNDSVILGAGVTGLSAGLVTKTPIYEAQEVPGGICASYYIDREGGRSYSRVDEESYRFEIGGGHWIFGADNKVLKFIRSLATIKRNERKSAVYFRGLDLYVPYPIQNHLSYFPEDIRQKVLDEVSCAGKMDVSTLADWLEVNFGKTLCKLFFHPFHELYTAGLYKNIAPQDNFKTPIDKKMITKGAKGKTPAVGYNATFFYPSMGLDVLNRRMADRCEIYYGKRAVRILLDKREVIFKDRETVKYRKLISTLPINLVLELTGLDVGKPDPFSSVLVVNIGAKRGEKCPPYHWLYIPKSRSGFHRVGFYSNVDVSFLPASSRKRNDRVAIYVEKSYKEGERPDASSIDKLSDTIVQELTEWGFIGPVETVDKTWVEVAYTWVYPNSKWRDKAINILESYNIYQTGRYGKWHFQGIAESIKDGLEIEKTVYGR